MQSALKQRLIGGLIIMGYGMAATAQDLTLVNPPALGDPTQFGYSTAAIAPAGTRIAYISGQGGMDGIGALSPEFDVQVAQAFANLRTALDGIGARPDQVAKITIYVVDHDMSKLGPVMQNVMQTFGERLPAQTLVGVPKLALDGMLFEVEAVVAMP